MSHETCLFHLDGCVFVKCAKEYETCSSYVNGSSICSCPICEESYEMVCGSDGITYPSKCYLEKHACINDLGITLARRSACGRIILFCGFYGTKGVCSTSVLYVSYLMTL